MLAGKRILLIIGGGIAAYKALELIRLIQKAGGAVTPVLTRAAAEFVTPLSVGALARSKVHEQLFDLTSDDDRMRRFVIDERNDVFLEAMLPLMGQRSVFTGVGAMHLPGEKGLIEMLRGKGYTVEPVRGSATSKSARS